MAHMMTQSFSAHCDEVSQAVKRLDSDDPAVVIMGLNVLTRKSYRAVESHALHLEVFPQMVVSLACLLDAVNPITALIFHDADKGSRKNKRGSARGTPGGGSTDGETDGDLAHLSIRGDGVEARWEVKLASQGKQEIKALAYDLDSNALLLNILNLLRNLSFDATNEQLLSASAPLLSHLVGLLLVAVECSSARLMGLTSSSGCSFYANSPACGLALETLANIASRVDLCGRRRLAAHYFCEDASALLEEVPFGGHGGHGGHGGGWAGHGGHGGHDAMVVAGSYMGPSGTQSAAFQRAMLQLRLHPHMSSASLPLYLSAAHSLLSAITLILGGSGSVADRGLSIRALEMLAKLALNPDNATQLQLSPQPLFCSLASLLCASTTALEPLVPDNAAAAGDPLGRRRAPLGVWLNSHAVPVAVNPAGSAAALAAVASELGGLDMGVREDLSASGQRITFCGVPAEVLHADRDGADTHRDSSVLTIRLTQLTQAEQLREVEVLQREQEAHLQMMQTQLLQSWSQLSSSSVAPFFSEASDAEVRDSALESLHALAHISPALAARLGTTPRLVELLLRVALAGGPGYKSRSSSSSSQPAYLQMLGAASISANSNQARSDSSLKAVQILTMVLAQPESMAQFLTLRCDFVAATCCDDLIADLVCNKALPLLAERRLRAAGMHVQVEQAQVAEAVMSY